jgi:hypothetical protein
MASSGTVGEPDVLVFRESEFAGAVAALFEKTVLRAKHTYLVIRGHNNILPVLPVMKRYRLGRRD